MHGKDQDKESKQWASQEMIALGHSCTLKAEDVCPITLSPTIALLLTAIRASLC